MNERQAKAIRKKAKKLAARQSEEMIPKFKAFVNNDLRLSERISLAWKIIWKRF